MVAAIAHPPPAVLASATLLRLRSQMSFACLAMSQLRLEQSCTLIRAGHRAMARTHALGVQYADWRLRLDIATELRYLMGGLDGHEALAGYPNGRLTVTT